MENLNCAVCYEKYSENGAHDPRVCPCGHTFCLSCLEMLLVRVCPICRQPMPIGVIPSELPRNLSIVAMLSISITETNATSTLPSITDMSAEQLEELQHNVKERLREERLKLIFSQIDDASREKVDVENNIFEEEHRLLELRALVEVYERNLSNSRLRLLEIEKRRIDLEDQIRAYDASESGQPVDEQNGIPLGSELGGVSTRPFNVPSTPQHGSDSPVPQPSVGVLPDRRPGSLRHSDGWSVRLNQVVPEPLPISGDNREVDNGSNNSHNHSNLSSVSSTGISSSAPALAGSIAGGGTHNQPTANIDHALPMQQANDAISVSHLAGALNSPRTATGLGQGQVPGHVSRRQDTLCDHREGVAGVTRHSQSHQSVTALSSSSSSDHSQTQFISSSGYLLPPRFPRRRSFHLLRSAEAEDIRTASDPAPLQGTVRSSSSSASQRLTHNSVHILPNAHSPSRGYFGGGEGGGEGEATSRDSSHEGRVSLSVPGVGPALGGATILPWR